MNFQESNLPVSDTLKIMLVLKGLLDPNLAFLQLTNTAALLKLVLMRPSLIVPFNQMGEYRIFLGSNRKQVFSLSSTLCSGDNPQTVS